MLERILGLPKRSLALLRSGNDNIEKVEEEDVPWQEMARNVLGCVQDGGFYYETQETPPPYSEVDIGTFYEVAVRDENEEYYEVVLGKFHYPGDVGETCELHLSQPVTRDLSIIHASISVRSNVNKIKFSPDSLVIRDRSVSKGFVSLTSEERLNLLDKLRRAYVDVSATQMLFDQYVEWGRAVHWMKDRPVGLLDIPG